MFVTCNQTFAMKSRLKTYQRVHTKVENYKEDIVVEKEELIRKKDIENQELVRKKHENNQFTVLKWKMSLK